MHSFPGPSDVICIRSRVHLTAAAITLFILHKFDRLKYSVVCGYGNNCLRFEIGLQCSVRCILKLVPIVNSTCIFILAIVVNSK